MDRKDHGSMDWFEGKSTGLSPMIFMGKSMVSGLDFPPKNQSIEWISGRNLAKSFCDLLEAWRMG